MSRKGADEVSGNPTLQARMRLLRQDGSVQEMSATTRDALIMHLHEKGHSDASIGKVVGLTRRGVGMAIQRIRDGRPGRVRGG
jgi:hypothetical protein